MIGLMLVYLNCMCIVIGVNINDIYYYMYEFWVDYLVFLLVNVDWVYCWKLC